MELKRVLLKLSGEALAGDKKTGFDEATVKEVARQVKTAVDDGIEVGIVIGGGNIFRGLSGVKKGFDRVKGDQMGMLATVINSLALQTALEGEGAKAKVLTSIRMEPIGELYSKAKALELMPLRRCAAWRSRRRCCSKARASTAFTLPIRKKIRPRRNSPRSLSTKYTTVS